MMPVRHDWSLWDSPVGLTIQRYESLSITIYLFIWLYAERLPVEKVKHFINIFQMSSFIYTASYQRLFNQINDFPSHQSKSNLSSPVQGFSVERKTRQPGVIDWAIQSPPHLVLVGYPKRQQQGIREFDVTHACTRKLIHKTYAHIR